MYDVKQQNTIKNITERYAEKTTERSRYEELIALDAKVRRPANIFSYIFGGAGALILGAGMCLAMGVLAEGAVWAMPVGVVVGVIGIAMCAANYFIYKAVLKSRRKKYAKQILSLSDELLNK